jgi:(S)-mandelate dehydrogenase
MPWKRRTPRPRNAAAALNVSDLRELAQRRVPHFVFEYVEGGAEDEATLRANRSEFARWRLVPRTLVDTCARHTRVELFGRTAAAPLIVAPTGFNGMLHPQGDIALARAAVQLGIPFTLSTFSTARLEEVARRAGGRLWQQLYVMKDRSVARDLIARAAAAGCEALVFTTDANVFGSREWDRRSYRAPGRPTLRSKFEALLHPRWLWQVMQHGLPQLRNLEGHLPADVLTAVGGSTIVPQLVDASISWDDVAWIREAWRGKLLLKGLLDARDAERAASLGCDGIVISNHGGRQLDHCVTSLEVLPEIKRAVGTRMTLIIDGGILRGTDIAKALALGARAVMVGRAALYGLAAGAEAGVAHALGLQITELHRVLGELGCTEVAQLTPAHLRAVHGPEVQDPQCSEAESSSLK